MERKFQVLTVGELNADLILNQIDGFPELGKEKLARDLTLTLGSSSAIFASNLSSLGVKVAFLGKIGDDSFGCLVKEALENKGVDISQLIEDKNSVTGVTVVLNYGEDRAMVTCPGAMEHLLVQDVSEEALRSAQHMHFASLFLQNGIKPDIVELFSKAKKCGLTTSLDTQWDPNENWGFDYEHILPLVDVFLPNEKELLLLTGSTTVYTAIEKIKPYANTVVVKNGSKGSTLFAKDEAPINLPAFLNKNVVDAIGAGDSFNAGFISCFVRGFSLKDCQVYGNLSGAINTTGAGGTSAFITKEHIVSVAREKFKFELSI